LHLILLLRFGVPRNVSARGKKGIRPTGVQAQLRHCDLGPPALVYIEIADPEVARW